MLRAGSKSAILFYSNILATKTKENDCGDERQEARWLFNSDGEHSQWDVQSGRDLRGCHGQGRYDVWSWFWTKNYLETFSELSTVNETATTLSDINWKVIRRLNVITFAFKKMPLTWAKALMLMSNQDINWKVIRRLNVITFEFKKLPLAWVKALMLMSNQDMLVKLVICKVSCILSLTFTMNINYQVKCNRQWLYLIQQYHG